MTNSFTMCAALTMGLFSMSLFSMASAHMKMSSPVPFGVGLDNSPLSSKNDFPCKQRGASTYQFTSMNNIPVNEPVLLAFDGSAVHGGGTCQVSVSLDKEPTADSTFKVVQTFQGKCPETALTFNLPEGFPNTEQATLAWTWFNQIGNREFYMNCAPIAVTGGNDDMSVYDSLPDMQVANIPTTDCTTVESSDPTMPNPGNLITAPGMKPSDLVGPKCSSGSGSQKNAQSGSGKSLAAYGAPAKDSNVITPVNGGSESGSDGGSSGGASSAPPAGNDGMYTQPATPAQPSAPAGGNNGMYSQPAAPSSAASSVETSAAAAPTNDGSYSQGPAAPAQPSSAVETSSAVAYAPSASMAGSSSTVATSSPAAYAPSASAAEPSSVATTSSAVAYAPKASTFATMTVSASSAASPTSYSTLSPSVGAGVSGPSSAPAASPSGYSTPSTGSSDSTACSTNGAVVCNGSDQFGLCNNGAVVWQAAAAGTHCTNGTIQKRSFRGGAHVRRHAHGAHKVRAASEE